MKTSIAILRGINVTGHKKMKMTELKSLFEGLGFTQVSTYIQSGNVVFNHDMVETDQLQKQIKKAIQSKFNFEVDVFIRSASELHQALKNNPYVHKYPDKLNRIFYAFLSETPHKDMINALAKIDHSPEEYFIDREIIYFYVPNGYGRAKINNNYFEKKLKVSASTKNWKTVRKLYQMAHD